MARYLRAVALVVALGSVLSAAACNLRNEPAITEDRRALQSASETSSLLGFALEAALPEETAATALTWEAPPDGVAFTPSESTTQLTRTLRLPDPTSELHRIEEVEVHCDPQRVTTNTRTCDDRLDAVLILRLQTEDGALAEEIPVDFVAFSETEARWNQSDLDFQDFAGSFEMSANVGEPGTLRLGVFGSITDGAAEGSLIGDLIVERRESGQSGTGTGMVFTVARWNLE